MKEQKQEIVQAWALERNAAYPCTSCAMYM